MTRVSIPYEAKNDGRIRLYVGKPELIKDTLNSYHIYPITGEDSNGPIEIKRRYNLFYVFRQVLVQRFAGLYVPPVSPKQVTGNSAESTL